MAMESIYLCLVVIAICIFVVRDQKRRNFQADILKRGIRVCGKVRHVKHEWLGRRSLSRHYELYAEFEFNDRTHYALQKYRHKPHFQEGDPIGICFDPNDPDENMILDFSDSGANQ